MVSAHTGISQLRAAEIQRYFLPAFIFLIVFARIVFGNRAFYQFCVFGRHKNLHTVAASVRNQNFITVINQGARLVKLTPLISSAAKNIK